ncbi:MAG: hypothetical protein LBQ58_09435 [Synergistaceae bacterium]|jgi:DNA-binding Lrp family transcriptional regulator|nr:hypothetical protein [Synergistaceae bacterium]
MIGYDIGIGTRLCERDFALVASSLEAGLKVVQMPFRDVAQSARLSEERVLEISRGMLDSGYIRRFGAFFDFRRVGLKGYLFGVELPCDKKPEVVSFVGNMGCVTHSYARRHSLGLWFTAILDGDDAASAIGGSLRERGLKFVALGVRERIKLRPSFAPVEAGASCFDAGDDAGDRVSLSAGQMNIARALQNNFDISGRPYALIADLMGLGESGERIILDEAKRLFQQGILRRIGASLNHNRAGWMANSLTAWDMSRLSEAEVSLAARVAVTDRPWASHCYLRYVVDGNLPYTWPYNLYIMIHALSDDELDERERTLFCDLQPRNFLSMRTEAEYKKISFKI